MAKIIAHINRGTQKIASLIGRPAAVATATTLAVNSGIPKVTMWMTGAPVIPHPAITVSAAVLATVGTEVVLIGFGREAEVDVAYAVGELRRQFQRAERSEDYKDKWLKAATELGLDKRTAEGLFSKFRYEADKKKAEKESAEADRAAS